MVTTSTAPSNASTTDAAAFGSGPSIVRVTLSDEAFSEALQRYIDEEKPDPLQTKQMESWRMIWTNEDVDDPLSFSTDIELASFTPSHILSGTLEVYGEYLIVTLRTLCFWLGDLSNGSFRFTCHASARPIDTRETKLQKSMKHRLSTDELIRKILIVPTTDDSSTATQELELFCSAFLDTKSTLEQPSQMEERVYSGGPIAEAIRRAIFSSAESPLDVFDFFCRLPYLPSSHGTDVDTTPLANRARLRLLEEATYDACDNEPDDELVEDLRIREPNHHDDEIDDVERSHSRSKKSKR